MPALNYKKHLAPLVESGEKRQTIRADRKDGRNPHVGDRLYHFTGLRTKVCRKLREDDCTSVENICIDCHSVVVGTMYLTGIEIEVLAIADGFKDTNTFIEFFRTGYELPFYGKLIKW